MFNTIIDAGKRLKGHANITPVMTSGTLNKLVGASVYLKCENFQKIGAFKFRGAFNSISKLSNKEKSKGVITYSSESCPGSGPGGKDAQYSNHHRYAG